MQVMHNQHTRRLNTIYIYMTSTSHHYQRQIIRPIRHLVADGMTKKIKYTQNIDIHSVRHTVCASLQRASDKNLMLE